MKLYDKYGVVLLKIFLLILVVQYFNIPLVYDSYSVCFCFIIILVSVAIYIYKKRFKNYLSFEMIFLVTLILLYYIYPVFVYSDETAYLFSFGLKYDVDCITKGVNIASIGILSFIIGNCTSTENKNDVAKTDCRLRSNLGLSIFCTILYVLFYIVGGFQHFVDVYKEGVRESTISSYVLILIQCAFPLLVFNELWNMKVSNGKYKCSYYSFFISIVIALHLMYVGSRTNALLIILPIVIIYSEFFKPQSKRNLFLFFIVGIVVMWIIQNTRAGNNFNTDSIELYYLLSDFFIPNTDTYLAVEIVNNNGSTNGLTVLSQFLAVIPFAQSVVYPIFDIGLKDTSSSHLFTDYIGSYSGMGTNIVADLFLAFNLLGIILFMYLLGRYCYVWHRRLTISYNYSVMYMILSGLSIYIVRSSMFYSLRFFFFTIIISLIFCKAK